MKKKAPFAVLVDMDGVLADTNPYHKAAYRAFCARHGKHLSDAEFERHVFGRTNRAVLERLFGRLSPASLRRYENEKEALFRRLARPRLRATPGAKRFFERLRRRRIPVALATSAPPANVRFLLNLTRLRKFFPVILDSRHVKKGKPNPEIFLKSARRLGVPASRCVVLEDSISGVRAARRAKMKVIAFTTTHSARELRAARHTVKDFRGIPLDDLV